MLPSTDPVPSIAVPAAELDVPALRRHLVRYVEPLAGLGPLTVTRLTGGRSHLTYLLTDGTTSVIVRRPPRGSPGAHDVGREYRMIEAVGRCGVPVPELLYHCAEESELGFPFMVMRSVGGVILRDADDLALVPPGTESSLCDRLVDALVSLHQADARAVLDGSYARAGNFAARQIRSWHGRWRRWQTGEVASLEALHEVLAGAVPPQVHVGVVHGDFRFDNVILTPGFGAVAAILDWELSTVGDLLTDLGLLVAFWAGDDGLNDVLAHKRLTAALGVPAAAVVERYASRTGSTGEHLDFYVALGYFKWAVIRQGVYRRQLDGAMPPQDLAMIGHSVVAIAERGLAVSRRFAG
jgi:aminoglycoside phosphotransferase (APT) family kinase protein